MRLVFMGTPQFAVPALEALIQAGHEIVCVYTQPPRPAGRGQKLQASPIQLLAEAHGLPVRSPLSLKDPEAQTELKSWNAQAAVVVAYGLLLPQAALDVFPLGCLNIHFSLLPRWRGAAPVQHAIMAGDKETGIGIMRMERKLDTGPLYAMKAYAILPNETAPALNDRLAQEGAGLLLDVLKALEAGTATLTPQASEGVSYAHKINNQDRWIDWTRPAETIRNHIRGMWPNVSFTYQGEAIRVLEAERVSGRGKPGEALDHQLTIACGVDALRLVTVQRAGKKPMAASEMLRGYAIPQGTILPCPATN